MLYLRRDKNSLDLGDYNRYLRNGGGELVESLIDARIGIVSWIVSIVASIPILQWSSSTSWGSIVFIVANSLITNYLGTRKARMTVSE